MKHVFNGNEEHVKIGREKRKTGVRNILKQAQGQGAHQTKTLEKKRAPPPPPLQFIFDRICNQLKRLI